MMPASSTTARIALTSDKTRWLNLGGSLDNSMNEVIDRDYFFCVGRELETNVPMIQNLGFVKLKRSVSSKLDRGSKQVYIPPPEETSLMRLMAETRKS